MRYLGGKARLAPWICNLINKERTSLNQWYVEPFVGGANVICNIEGNRIAIDNNKYVIAMWQALQKGWIPPINYTQEQYNAIRTNPEKYKLEVVGFVGTCSFGGKWFGGLARPHHKNNGIIRNYSLEAKTSVLKQIQSMLKVKFYNLDSLKINKFPRDAIIYCDPPYENTTKYKDDFDSTRFWLWAKELSKKHVVLVSSFKAPIEWKCIFEQYKINGTFGQSVEKIFRLS